jgi:AcrR family transcriptional regulator
VPTPAAPRRRSYDSSGRQAAARAHRAAVLRACRELFLRDGYQATTVKAVARHAGVSAETVYKTFGSKAALAKALWDVTLAGDDEPLTMAERPALREVLATADLAAKLELYARFVCDTHERLAPLIALLTQAGPEAAQVVADTERERLTGVTAFVAHLRDQDLLATDADPARTADACWVLTGPQPFSRLTGDRGWDGAAYRRWLAAMLAASLRPGPA